ncbi:MAG: hypothetical protein JWO56_3353 [Acidobacteria bacterium]|nr:hypothetical protein [Acidobacteriota bacterium]
MPPTTATAITAVPTAIALFIGYTERAVADGEPVTGKPFRIENAARLEEVFGGPARPLFRMKSGGRADAVAPVPATLYYLNAALRLFYANGGGEAYVLSLGSYGPAETPDRGEADVNPNVRVEDFRKALDAARDVIDAAVLVMPDAVLLPPADSTAIAAEALALCAEVDRCVAILDVRAGALPVGATASALLACVAEFQQSLPLTHASYGAAYAPWLVSTLFDASEITLANLQDAPSGLSSSAQAKLEEALVQQASLVPPSGAIAGVYASVDASRGVWAAPANVALDGIDQPAQRIGEHDQPEMNTPATGLSVGAIRWFPNHGVLVWGARTLDGRNPEWRYINTRRNAIMIAESIRRGLPGWATAPNDATTWASIERAVSSFLTFLWSRGALAGSTASSAFHVEIGLGSTMTADDLAAGVIRLHVSVAFAHPAEFTVLEFVQQVAVA